MSASRHSKLVHLNARLETLRKNRPVVFNLIALRIALSWVAALLLIEWMFL
jgi:hypothetical protein